MIGSNAFGSAYFGQGYAGATGGPVAGTFASTGTGASTFALSAKRSAALASTGTGASTFTATVVSPLAYYGEQIGADGLNNAKLDNVQWSKLAIRFRAEQSSTLPDVSLYVKTDSPGHYSGGTGGSWTVRVETDDGSGFPTGTLVAAGATVTAATPITGTSGAIQTFTFGTAPTLVAGTVYHIVVTNADGSPGTNFVSMNSLDLEKGTSPLIPTVADSELALLTAVTTTLAVNLTRYPIFDAHYGNGVHQGQPYYNAASGSGQKSINGTNNMARLNVTLPAAKTANGFSFYGYRQSSTTQDLVVKLKNAAGTTLDTQSMTAASAPVGSTGSGVGAAFMSVTWTSPQSLSAAQYFVELSSPGETVPWIVFPILQGGSGFAASLLSPGFSDGYLESTTNAGGTWAAHLSSTVWKMQGYFLTPVGSLVAATFTSTGSGASVFTRTAERAATLTSTGSGTSSFTATAAHASTFTSTGTGASTLTLSAKRQAAFASTGTGTSTFTGSALSASIAGPVLNWEYSSATSSTTSTFSPPSAIPVGTLIMLFVVRNTSNTVPTCTDNSTQSGAANTYTALAGTTSSALVGNWMWCVTTRQILATDTLTVITNFATRRDIRISTWTGTNQTSPVDFQVGRVGLSASPARTPSSGVTAALASSGELALHATAWAGGAVLSGFSNSGGNGYTSLGTPAGSGGASNRVEAQVSYKLNADATGEFDQHSWTSVVGAGSALVTLLPAVTVSLKQATFSSTGSGASTFTRTAKRALVIASTGSGTSVFTRSARRRVTLTSTGSSATTFSAARRRPATLASTGTSTSLFALTNLRSAAFSSTGTSTSIFAAARLRAAALASTGTGASTLVAHAYRTTTFTSGGVGDSDFAAARLLHGASMTSPGTSTSAFAANALRNTALSSTGNGASTFTRAAKRRASMHEAPALYPGDTINPADTIYPGGDVGGVSSSTFNATAVGGRQGTFSSAGGGTSTFLLVNRRAVILASTGTGTSSFVMASTRRAALTSAGTGSSAFLLARLRAAALSSIGASTSAWTLTAKRTATLTSTGTGASLFTPAGKRYRTFSSDGASTSIFSGSTSAHGGTFTSIGIGSTTITPSAKRAAALSSTGSGGSLFDATRKRAATVSSTGSGTTTFSQTARRAGAFASSGVGSSLFTLTAAQRLFLNSTGTGTSVFALAAKRQLVFGSTGHSTSTWNPLAHSTTLGQTWPIHAGKPRAGITLGPRSGVISSRARH